MGENAAEATHHQAWLSAILSIVPSAIIAIDAQQQITLFNEAAEQMFGYQPNEIMGQPLGLLIPHRFRSVHASDVLQFWLEPEKVRRMGKRRQVAGLRKDGSEFPAEASISKIEIGGEKIFAVALQDITERQRQAEQIRLHVREVDHRSKNLLSVVQAIARQTTAATPVDFASRFGERIQALAANQNLLLKNEWKGAALDELVRSQLAHFGDLAGTRIEVEGPSLFVSAAAAQALGMAFHELATNAAKYGALASDSGSISIEWGLERETEGAETFMIAWREQVTHPIAAPSKRGFGLMVICDMAELSLGAQVDLEFRASGLIWRLRCPAGEVLGTPDG